ncbi:Uncharacterized protein PBTT_09138 [Plasmodiophora brassicae]
MRYKADGLRLSGRTEESSFKPVCVPASLTSPRVASKRAGYGALRHDRHKIPLTYWTPYDNTRLALAVGCAAPAAVPASSHCEATGHQQQARQPKSTTFMAMSPPPFLTTPIVEEQCDQVVHANHTVVFLRDVIRAEQAAKDNDRLMNLPVPDSPGSHQSPSS